MTAAFILGKRGSENGVFIAPPSVDATTATSDQLLLHITKNIAQLVMRGQAYPLPKDVTLGFGSYVPVVILTAYGAPTGWGSGYLRPYGNYWVQNVTKATVSSSTMHISTTGATSCGYLVFNRSM